MSDKILLEMKDICKNFPGVKALDNVSLSVREGTVHALMGENGAGKSTLMKCLFGIYEKDSGQIFLEGKEVSFKNPKDALEKGVAMVHQELNQALKRSVMDNMWLGRYPKYAGFITSEKKMYTETMEIFKTLGIDTNPKEIMSRMSVAQRQMVEIAKAVSYDAKIIVLDEPFSGLDPVNAMMLEDVVKDEIRRGKIVLLSSHQMNYIEEFCENIAILNDGEISVSGELRTIKRNYPRDKIVVVSDERDEIARNFDCTDGENGELILRLARPEDKQRTMKQLADSYDIDEMRVFEPSLNSIFVEYTGGLDEEASK